MPRNGEEFVDHFYPFNSNIREVECSTRTDTVVIVTRTRRRFLRACLCEDDEFLLMSSLKKKRCERSRFESDDFLKNNPIQSSNFKEKTFLVCLMHCPFRPDSYV